MYRDPVTDVAGYSFRDKEPILASATKEGICFIGRRCFQIQMSVFDAKPEGGEIESDNGRRKVSLPIHVSRSLFPECRVSVTCIFLVWAPRPMQKVGFSNTHMV